MQIAPLLMELLHKEYTASHKGSEHMQTKHKLSNITDSKQFWTILRESLLSREEYDTVALSVVGKKSFVEIGEALNISERTARYRFESALAKIKSQL